MCMINVEMKNMLNALMPFINSAFYYDLPQPFFARLLNKFMMFYGAKLLLLDFFLSIRKNVINFICQGVNSTGIYDISQFTKMTFILIRLLFCRSRMRVVNNDELRNRKSTIVIRKGLGSHYAVN